MVIDIMILVMMMTMLLYFNQAVVTVMITVIIIIITKMMVMIRITMIVFMIIVMTIVVVMAIEEKAMVEAIGSITVMEEREEEEEMIGVSSVQPSLLADNHQLQVMVRVMEKCIYIRERGGGDFIPVFFSAFLYLYSSPLFYHPIDVMKSFITLPLFYSTL